MTTESPDRQHPSAADGGREDSVHALLVDRIAYFLRMSGAFRVVQVVVIVIGLGAMTAMSDARLRESDGALLSAILWLCVAFFAVEMSFDIRADFKSENPGRYWKSTEAIIDVLAVLVVPLARLAGLSPETAWLFSVTWVLKLAPVSPGLSMLGRVVVVQAQALFSVVVLFIVTLFGSAMTIYLAERRPQPDKLGRILDGLWWTVATLTGGNTDVSPTTQAGHLVATFDMLLGLGIFGLLTGILATGFVDEHRRRDFVQNWNLVTGVPFFRTLDPRGVIDIARLLRRWDVPERTTVVRRGRAGDCMYFIASGMVEVLVEPHPVKLAAGAFFGEMALLGDGRRGATVVTVAPSTLLILEHSDFRSFMAHHPDLARAIDEAAAVRRPTAETARAIAADDECASTPSLDLIHE